MSDDGAALSAMSSLSPEPIPDLQPEELDEQQPARPATKPSESWDVAFVYAFLTRFSQLFAAPTWPSTIFQFEAAFLADIPALDPSNSVDENSAASTPDVALPPSRKTPRVPASLLTPAGEPPSLVPVVEWFVDFLIKGHIPKPDSKKKGKRNFMLELSDLLMLDLSSPLSERWEGFNKLRHSAEGQILNLGWQDRAIMLRSACEWALNSSPYVRGQISAQYNLLPQRVVRRKPEENPLIMTPIGRDSQRRPYYRLDDTARVYKAGSFYSVNNYWEVVSDNREDLGKLAASLKSVEADNGEEKPGPSPEMEAALKAHIETEIIPNLGLCEERLRHLSRTYNEELKAQQRADRQAQAWAAAHPEAEAAPEEPEILNGGRRAAAKRINYKDIEDGRAAMELAAAQQAAKKAKKRPRVSEPVEAEVEEDSNNRRSSRTNKGAAPSRFGNNAPQADLQEELNRRRSSRTSRGARSAEEEDPVALVQAYIAAHGNGGEEESVKADTTAPMEVDELAPSDGSVGIQQAPAGIAQQAQPIVAAEPASVAPADHETKPAAAQVPEGNGVEAANLPSIAAPAVAQQQQQQQQHNEVPKEEQNGHVPPPAPAADGAAPSATASEAAPLSTPEVSQP